MFIKRSIKVFVIAIAAFVFATITYAFAATNTISDPGRAGDGSGTITGYTVTSVTYTLDSGNPVNITAVDFDLDAAATTVKVKLATGDTLDTCSHKGTGNRWTCPVNVNVSSASSLTVVAAQ